MFYQCSHFMIWHAIDNHVVKISELELNISTWINLKHIMLRAKNKWQKNILSTISVVIS
jgi:hypothetical protein